ncbi:unnamed protein product [Dicrocoelium dendriticum]|nr:unnamed protein product [Dicrocoelium dendriticum]
MDGGTKVQRVPLDEYLSDLRSSAQTLTCGYTHQALDDELQYQSYLKEKIDLVQDSPASNNLAVESELRDISNIIDVNQECLHYLGGITSLEDFYSDITAFNTKRALALVSQRMGAKFWKRKLSGNVKRAWQNLGRYSELVTLHLKHAADFHQLYYDARQIEMQLNERCRKFIRSKKQYNWNRCTGSVVEARELANLLKADYEHLNHLAAKAGEILDRSSTIVPIHLRHAKLEHPVKGIMLCDYETPMFKLCAGDEVLVRTSSNEVGEGHPDVNEVATNGTSTVSESVHDEESGDLTHQKPERLQERMAKTPSRPFGWEREESTTVTSDSNTGVSASYLTGSSHRKPTADKLHWFVRTPDGYVESRVPAVCVLIPGPDTDACQRAIALNRVLLAAWKDIIDERLAVCLEFFRRFLQQLCDSECIVTANDEEFKQLLHELIYSLSLPPTAEGETANREFLSLIEQTQTHWEKTRRADLSESTNGVHLGLTDIAAFHSVLVWMKINMKANREYEEKMHSPADVRQAMEQYSTDTFRITEAIELLSETIKKDRRKVDELLQQLRFWNQTASTELSEVLTPSLDDSRELLISSGSEVSDSDFSDLGTETEITSSPAYSEVIFRSDRYAFYTKQLYTNGGNFLPAIFTHDEQTLTNSIYSDGYSTSETENDLSEEEPLPFVELDKNLKEIAGEEVSEMQAGGVIPSKRPTRFVSTTNLDMNVMIERELDTQRNRHRCYRSRRHLEAPAAQANYSVVYIEVTRDEQRDTVTEQIGGNHRSKETQTEQRVAAPKTLKMKELTEVEEEDKTVIRKKEIKTLTSVKRQTNEVSAQAKPLYVDRATDVQISLQETMVQDTRSIPCTRVWWRSKQKQNLHQESREKTADVRRRRSASWDITHDTEAGHDHWRLTKSEERKFSATRNEVHRKLKNYVDKVAMYKTRETKAKEEKQAEKEGARKPEEQKVTKWTAQEERTPKKKADTKDNQTSTQIEKPTLDMATQTQAYTKIEAVQVSSEPKEKKSRTEQRILDLTKEKDDKERKDEEKRTTEKSEEERKQIQGEKQIKVTKEISMVGVRAEGLEEPGEELEPTMRRIPLLEEDRKPGLAVSGAMIDAWCSVSLSDWVDSQLSVRPPAMPTRVCGVQTDAVLQPEGVSALVDRSSVSVSTLVGVYGSESTWTQTAEAEVESTRVWVSDRVDVTQLTKPALSLKGACVQASLLTSPLVEAAQHVLMEMRSGVSQTPIVSDTGVSDAERVRMLDVCTSYALGRVEVSDEKSYVMHADKRLWSGPPLIEASTTNAQFGVRDMRSVSVVEPTDARPGHCSTCGQRLWMETERGEMATDVDRRKPEYMEASVGADYAGVEGLERVTGVVSIGRADGTMQTRPVLSYYVTDEGHMVGVRAEGLEEPGEELEPTMRRIPLLEEDRKPGLAVSGAMIDAWCSVSLSDWVDSQLSVRPPAMPTRVCGVQTDAVLQPEGVSALVDRSSVSVSTLVGVYGSESTWTQTAEAEVESTRVWVSDRVDVTQLTKPALSLKGACVQASLLTSPLVEAAQHVLMEMRSGMSQTPIVSDTGVSDAERVRMLDVCTSYALGRVEVSDEKSYVMHADKRLWSGPPLIEASTTNAQFGVRDMRSVSVVEPTDARPGHCSTCGQRLWMETERGEMATDVDRRKPEYMEASVGADYAGVEGLERVTGVVSIGRADGTMQTRPVLSYYVTDEGHMVGVRAEGLEEPGEELEPTMRRIPLLEEDRKPGLAVSGAMIDAWCSVSLSDWVDSQLSVRSPAMPTRVCGVQTDAVLQPEGVSALVDRSSVSVSTLVGVYGSESTWTQTAEAEVESTRVWVSDRVDVTQLTKPALSLKGACVQASLLTSPLVEAAQHVLMEMRSGMSQTPIVSDTGVSDAERVRMLDVCTSYALGRVEVSDEKSYVMHADKRLWSGPPLIEASTTNAQFGVRDMRSVSVVEPTDARPGHCSTCGQRLWMETERGEMATDVDRRKPEYMEASVGADYAGVEGLERVTGVVSIGRADGTMQTRPVLSYYVTDEGHMVGVRAEGLEEPGEELEPTMRRIPLLEEDRKPGLAVSGAMIDAWCSVSLSDWVDSQLSVRPPAMPTRVCGVQTDAVLQPEGVSALVDRSSVSVSTLVGVYGSESTWTQTAEAEVESTRVWVSDRVDVTQLTKPALSLKGACVQASLLTSPLVEAAQHVLMEMRSGMSQTPIVSDTGVSDAERVRMLDVCTSYALGRVEVSDEKSYVMHADKRLWSGPPLIEASTTNAQFGVRDMRSVSVVEPTDARPGHCSTCGQRLWMETERGEMATDVDRRKPEYMEASVGADYAGVEGLERVTGVVSIGRADGTMQTRPVLSYYVTDEGHMVGVRAEGLEEPGEELEPTMRRIPLLEEDRKPGLAVSGAMIDAWCSVSLSDWVDSQLSVRPPAMPTRVCGVQTDAVLQPEGVSALVDRSSVSVSTLVGVYGSESTWTQTAEAEVESTRVWVSDRVDVTQLTKPALSLKGACVQASLLTSPLVEAAQHVLMEMRSGVSQTPIVSDTGVSDAERVRMLDVCTSYALGRVEVSDEKSYVMHADKRLWSGPPLIEASTTNAQFGVRDMRSVSVVEPTDARPGHCSTCGQRLWMETERGEMATDVDRRKPEYMEASVGADYAGVEGLERVTGVVSIGRADGTMQTRPVLSYYVTDEGHMVGVRAEGLEEPGEELEPTMRRIPLLEEDRKPGLAVSGAMIDAWCSVSLSDWVDSQLSVRPPAMPTRVCGVQTDAVLQPEGVSALVDRSSVSVSTLVGVYGSESTWTQTAEAEVESTRVWVSDRVDVTQLTKPALSLKGACVQASLLTSPLVEAAQHVLMEMRSGVSQTPIVSDTGVSDAERVRMLDVCTSYALGRVEVSDEKSYVMHADKRLWSGPPLIEASTTNAQFGVRDMRSVSVVEPTDARPGHCSTCGQRLWMETERGEMATDVDRRKPEYMEASVGADYAGVEGLERVTGVVSIGRADGTMQTRPVLSYYVTDEGHMVGVRAEGLEEPGEELEPTMRRIPLLEEDRKPGLAVSGAMIDAWCSVSLSDWVDSQLSVRPPAMPTRVCGVQTDAVLQPEGVSALVDRSSVSVSTLVGVYGSESTWTQTAEAEVESTRVWVSDRVDVTQLTKPALSLKGACVQASLLTSPLVEAAQHVLMEMRSGVSQTPIVSDTGVSDAERVRMLDVCTSYALGRVEVSDEKSYVMHADKRLWSGPPLIEASTTNAQFGVRDMRSVSVVEPTDARPGHCSTCGQRLWMETERGEMATDVDRRKPEYMEASVGADYAGVEGLERVTGVVSIGRADGTMQTRPVLSYYVTDEGHMVGVRAEGLEEPGEELEPTMRRIPLLEEDRKPGLAVSGALIDAWCSVSLSDWVDSQLSVRPPAMPTRVCGVQTDAVLQPEGVSALVDRSSVSVSTLVGVYGSESTWTQTAEAEVESTRVWVSDRVDVTQLTKPALSLKGACVQASLLTSPLVEAAQHVLMEMRSGVSQTPIVSDTGVSDAERVRMLDVCTSYALGRVEVSDEKSYVMHADKRLWSGPPLIEASTTNAQFGVRDMRSVSVVEPTDARPGHCSTCGQRLWMETERGEMATDVDRRKPEYMEASVGADYAGVEGLERVTGVVSIGRADGTMQTRPVLSYYVTDEGHMVGVRAEGLEEPGEELEPTMRRIPLLEEDRKPGLAVSGAMIDAWCSVSLSDWVDSQLSVRPPAMPTRVCGVQTDAVLQPEGVSALVDRSSVSVSTLVGVYGSESTWTQTAEAEVESTRVWVSDRVDVTQLTKPALSLKGACVQASLLTSPLVEAAQHVLMEMRSGVSQTPIVSDTGVSDAERVRMLDVCTSYALGRVEVSDEKSYVMHADKRLWSGPPLIEASTTNAQFGVRDMRSVSVVEPTDARPGHCSTCGQRLWMETERGEMATDVDRRKPEYMEASVGADYAGVEGLERVTGVVSIGRADGTMQTRPVLSYYVTDEGHMVGVRAEGLEEPGEELEPTMRRIPLLEEDRKPGLAVSGAMIDAWCSVSLSDWVDSQLSVRPPAMPTRVCGVQTDAVLQPEGVSALVDRSSVSVSTLVGVYGSESTWTQTAEAEVESTRVWVSDRVDVTQLTKPALSLKGACVQASLLTSPLVEAAQHVLMEMRSGVSQTPIVSDTGVSDAERVRMLDVCTSYALGRVEVSDEKSYVMHADKRLWSGPPLIEASTTNAQFGVRDMRSVSVVEPTDARPGHCSTCGQRLWMETERGEMATDVDRRKPEYMEASVGADYAGVEGLERVTGVVSIGRADGTMQTRPVLSYYVTDEGHMVGVRAEGLEEPGEELEPTMRRIPLLEEDRKPGLAVSGAMIDAWCSVSLSDWVDSQLSVRPPAMPTRVCGVQTDAVLQPEGVSALVDRSSVSVSTLVGVYGSESTWTQTAEAEVQSTRVWVSDRVDVTQLTKPALSLKGACVQASLLTSPLVEAAQHVLMEMRSGVSQTPIVSDTGVSDAERVRMLDVCTSYALGRVEVSDEKSYVMHADKRLWSGPPLIEASTTNAQFGVRDMRSVSVVEPTDARPGHCSTCGQRLWMETERGEMATDVDRRKPEYMEASVGADYAGVEGLERVTGVVSIGRADGTMQTRPVLSYYVTDEGHMVGVRAEGLEEPGEELEPTMRRIPLLEEDRKPGLAVSGAMIDAWCSVSLSDWVDSQLSVRPPAMPTRVCGVQTDAVLQPEGVSALVDRSSVSVSTLVGVYGSESTWTQTAEAEVESTRVWVSDRVDVTQLTKPALSLKGACVQASLLTSPLVEAAQHVLMEMRSGVSQTPIVSDTGVSDAERVRMLDVCTSYALGRVEVSDEKSYVMHADKRLWSGPPLIEASTTNAQFGVRDMRSVSVVEPTDARPGHCSTCGQRLWMETERGEMATDVDRRKPEYMEASVGADYAGVEGLERVTGVVSIGRADGTMQTRPVLSYYVTDEGHMVGVRAEGLEEPGEELEPTMRRIPLLEEDRKPGLAVSGAMIDAWCSVSLSDWVDSQLSVRPPAMPTRVCGVQTDAVLQPEGVSALVDRSSVSVSTLVGVYGSESTWTQTAEAEVESTRVWVSDRVDVTQLTKPALSLKGACVQASLLTSPLVEAAQHVLMEMRSGVSQTPIVSDTGVSDAERVRMLDVCTSYALGRVEVSDEKSYVMHADKRLWSGPPLIEASTTNAQFGVRDMRSVSVVEPTDARPGHCSTCGQRLWMETERGEMATDVDRRKPEYMEASVGADYAGVEGLERVTGVVSIGRADGTMQTRPVLSYYVTDEGHMVGVRAEGLEEPGEELEPTMRRIPLLEEDRKPGLAVSGALIDAWCSVSLSDWVDSQLSVRPPAMPTRVCGVQTDAVLQPEGVSALVDRSSVSVSTLVGVYGSESTWTQTAEAEVESTRVWVSDRVDVTQLTKPALSLKGACVQASLLTSPLVEAAQHVLMEMRSGVSQTPIVSDTGVSDAERVRMLDVCTSYALGRVEVSDEKSYVMHADKRLWSGPPLIEASTTNAQFGVRDMRSVSVVEPTDARPGHCSTCGQHLFWEPFSGSLMAEVFPVFSSRCVTGSSSFFDLSLKLSSSLDISTFADFSCDTSFLVVRKHFGSQYSFVPDSYDVGVLACCSSSDFGSQFYGPAFVSSDASDVRDFSFLFYEDHILHDFHERHVEHFFVPSTVSSTAASDFSCQFSPECVFRSLSFSDRVRNLFCIRSEYFDCLNYEVYQHLLAHGIVSEAACLFSGDYRSSPDLPSRLIMPECYTQTDQFESYSFLCEFETTELCQSETSSSSNYPLYMSRRTQGYLREIGCMAQDTSKTVADIGVQVVTTVRDSESLPVSSVRRLGTPTYDLNAYDTYLLRNRLGQIRDEQVSFSPPVDSVPVQTEPAMDQLGGIFGSAEIYHQKLLRDELLEVGIQCNGDSSPDNWKDFSAYFEDRSIEEHYLEVTKKRKKRFLSEVTEEIPTEAELVMCDADIQTDSDSMKLASFGRWKESRIMSRCRQVQTEPIRLRQIRSSSELCWADTELFNVILVGINATHARENVLGIHSPPDLTVPILSDHASFLAEQLNHKTAKAASCQTISDDQETQHIEPQSWTEGFGSQSHWSERLQRGYREVEDADYSTIRDEYTHAQPAIIVQLRQRTCQYELLRTNMRQPEGMWNSIREVQSPTTNFFAPVGLAIRRGWIRLGDQNEYVDPSTGDSIPLETAYRMGRIRLATAHADTAAVMDEGMSVTLLIERIYFGWRKAKIISVIDTAKGDMLLPEAAVFEGVLEVCGDEIRFLDTMTNTWLTIEEAVGRQMIQVVAVDSSSDSSSSEEEEPATCRVYQVTHICPGGEDVLWMTTTEATRLGLFNGETGDIAADWPGRPSLHLLDAIDSRQALNVVPTKWFSFLTARHSGWIRLVRECDPQRWIVTYSMQQSEPGAVLLSRQINLVAYTNVVESDDFSESSDQSFTRWQQSRSNGMCTTGLTTEEPAVHRRYSASMSSSFFNKSTSQFPIRNTEHLETEHISYSMRKSELSRPPYATSEFQADSHTTSSSSGSPE